MNILDVFNADKWRAAIADFDAKRAEFFRELASLRTFKENDPAREQKRIALLSKAAPIEKSINAAYGALTKARDFLRSVKQTFSFNGQELGALPIVPVVIGISVAGVTAITVSVTTWLREVAYYRAGGKPKDDNPLATNIKWGVVLIGLLLAGPYFIKGLERYRVLK